MDKPATHEVAAILYKDDRVLACTRADATASGAWGFPAGGVEPGEDPLRACRRVVADQLGCGLSTTWLLTSLDYDDAEPLRHIDCFVCALAPKSEPAPKELGQVRWVSRDELLDVTWLTAHAELARLIGMEWDQVFMDMHL